MIIESGSSLGVFQSCPKKYFYTYEKRLEPTGYNSALGTGSLLHAFVEADRGGRPNAVSQELFSMRARYADDFAAAIDLDWKVAETLMYAWKQHWSQDAPFGNDKFEWVASEMEWGFDPSSLLHLVGKSDGVVRHKEWDALFLYELKTATDRDREAYIHDLEMNRQVTNNILALRERGYNIQGALYDIVWKPGVRARKGESESEVKLRMAGEVKERPAEQLERRIIYRNERIMGEHITDIVVTAEMLDRCRKDNTWPRFTGSCRKYNTLCQYFSGCLEGNEEILSTVMKVRDRKLPELSKETQGEKSNT